jgi:serine phosphatase RsbU (regulator of sigma subunit)
VHVVRLEYGTRTLTWASAGHPPPVLEAAREATLLEPAPGAPLGVGTGDTYLSGTRAAAPDEAIFLYTDGLIERGGEILTAGLDRLLEACAVNSGRSLDELVDGVLAELASGSHDDIAVLAVRLS